MESGEVGALSFRERFKKRYNAFWEVPNCDGITLNPITWEFTDKELERLYQIDKCTRWFPLLRIVIVMVLLMVGISIALISGPGHRTSLIIFDVILTVLMFGVFLAGFIPKLTFHLQFFVIVAFLIWGFFILESEILTDYIGPSTGMVGVIINLTTHSMLLPKIKLILGIILVVMYPVAHVLGGYVYGRMDAELSVLPSHIIDLLFCLAGCMAMALDQEKTYKEYFVNVSLPFKRALNNLEAESRVEETKVLKAYLNKRYQYENPDLEKRYWRDFYDNAFNNGNLMRTSFLQFVGLLFGTSQDLLVSAGQGAVNWYKNATHGHFALEDVSMRLVIIRLGVVAPILVVVLVLLLSIKKADKRSYMMALFFIVFMIGYMFMLLLYIPAYAEYRWIYFHFLMRSAIYIVALKKVFFVLISELTMFVVFNIFCACIKLSGYDQGIYDLWLIYVIGMAFSYARGAENCYRLNYLLEKGIYKIGDTNTQPRISNSNDIEITELTNTPSTLTLSIQENNTNENNNNENNQNNSNINSSEDNILPGNGNLEA
eukprot:TRINITY_DN398_c0_g1_i1.p1 TRINITY_DN398_c0_g1~~TRINITY_DN398_c0_g1_i1.p1  ORF type:complete len:544 (+),score=94.23 TRINITY_DN398_c0_g1_i1:87-1718(+)